MSFHEVLFPASLSFGSSGGPERRTEIVTLASGFEERNATWAHSRRRFDAGLGLRRMDDVHELLMFFEARLGRLHGFRWKDWADCKSCRPSGEPGPLDQPLGMGDGVRTSFPLSKTYSSGGVDYVRPIKKPEPGATVIAVEGVEAAISDDVAVDHSTGLVTFVEPPTDGAVITAGFVFHVPVRFDTDRIEVNLAAFEAGEIPSAPIIEVRV